jgi:hypothetical protein
MSFLLILFHSHNRRLVSQAGDISPPVYCPTERSACLARPRRDEFHLFRLRRTSRKSPRASCLLQSTSYCSTIVRGNRRQPAEKEGTSRGESSPSPSPKPHLALIILATLTKLTHPPHLTCYNSLTSHLLDPASIQKLQQLAREIALIEREAFSELGALFKKPGLSSIGLQRLGAAKVGFTSSPGFCTLSGALPSSYHNSAKLQNFLHLPKRSSYPSFSARRLAHHWRRS